MLTVGFGGVGALPSANKRFFLGVPRSQRWCRRPALVCGRGAGLSAAVSVGPGTVGLPTDTEYSRVGSSTWICPTSIVSTRIEVELVDVYGDQPNSSDWGPNRTRLELSM